MTPNCKKRVTLNRRSSSLLLDYQAMLRPSSTTPVSTNQYTQNHTLMSKNLLPNELPRLLKSSLRTPKSAPCTPSIAKSVQFHDQLEQICLFRKAQTPSAISQTNIFWDDHSSSDDEEQEEQLYKTSLVYANWPTRLADIIDRKNKVIRVEKNNIKLMDQDYIQGKISVRNLSYHKTVVIRYTFDFWESFDNVYAHYYTSQSSYDLFDFKIYLPKNATHLYFAVNYKVGNQEFWDNNDGRNYEIQLVSKPTTTTKPSSNDTITTVQSTSTKEQLKLRYDFTQSFNQARSALEPLYRNTSDFTQMKNAPTILQPQALPAAIPIPISATATRRRNASSPISCNSPLASSPSFMDLNSQSYMDLVNKYCFYSTSPSRSPIY